MSSTTIKPRIRRKKPQPKDNFLLGVIKATGGTIVGLSLLTSSIIAGGLVGLAISFRNLPDVRVLKNFERRGQRLDKKLKTQNVLCF